MTGKALLVVGGFGIACGRALRPDYSIRPKKVKLGGVPIRNVSLSKADEITSRAAQSAYTNWGLRCCTFREFLTWYLMLRRSSKHRPQSVPLLDWFCKDGEETWCAEKAASGLCMWADESRYQSSDKESA